MTEVPSATDIYANPEVHALVQGQPSEQAIRLQPKTRNDIEEIGPIYRAWKAAHISTRDVWYLLPEMWCHTDRPLDALTQPQWLEMFHAVGPLVRGRYFLPLTFPLTIYRAAGSDRRDRMAWTVDLAVAGHFREVHGRHGDAWLYRAVLPRADFVLAHIAIRPEREVIVDPEQIHDLIKRASSQGGRSD